MMFEVDVLDRPSGNPERTAKNIAELPGVIDVRRYSE